MLKLRRANVVSIDPLTVEVGGEHRAAWADSGLVGEVELGDEVVVNTQARDLGLGSGGFDVIHVNLSRGLRGGGSDGVHLMKFNYTSLQHTIDPVEIELGDPELGPKPPVLVISLHGHLAPAAWAKWPLSDLDGAIEACADSKSLVGLLMLREVRCRAIDSQRGEG